MRSLHVLIAFVLVAGAALADPGSNAREVTELEGRTRPPAGSGSPATLAGAGGDSVVDVVVAAGLGARDSTADSETSIAVDPEDPRRVVIAAFSGGWGDRAPLWLSADGGRSWHRRWSLPAPPGGSGIAGCPCDQTFAFGRGHRLYAATLAIDGDDRPTYVASTADPERASAWAWPVRGGVARRANPTRESDQPWIATGPDPRLPDTDLVYVGYTDYGVAPPIDRVAVLRGNVPSRRLRDRAVGTSPGAGSLAAAAMRVATATSGAAIALWQDAIGVDPDTCARRVELRLARSLDGGDTWDTGGDPRGILVARTLTYQGRNDDPSPEAVACRGVNQKFGGVNALLGGTAALAVDANGDALVVFGDVDAASGAQRLLLARVVFHTAGTPAKAVVHSVAAAVAALPSIAVAANGTLGVLFTTYDGRSARRPRFTTHLAQSSDGGASFTDRVLLSFLSPASSNSRPTQRVLGDYQQLKAVGDDFYAAFPGNGAAAGRSTESIDPFFARVPAGPTPP